MFYALNSLISKGENKPPFTLCIATNKTHLPQPSACLAWFSKVVLHVPVILALASVKKLTWSHPFLVKEMTEKYDRLGTLLSWIIWCCNMVHAAGCLNHSDWEEDGQEEVLPTELYWELDLILGRGLRKAVIAMCLEGLEHPLWQSRTRPFIWVWI